MQGPAIRIAQAGSHAHPAKRLVQYLFSRGFRYRKNVAALPGKPDIVLPKYKTAIFVNGCYWHRHEGCKYCYTPKSNVEFWEKKFASNVRNDRENYQKLENMGWRVLVLWECNIKRQFDTTMEKVVAALHGEL